MSEGKVGPDDRPPDNPGPPLLGDCSDVDTFSSQVLRTVANASRLSNEIPTSEEEFALYSSFPAFRKIMEVEGRRCLDLITQLMRRQNVANGGSTLAGRDLEEQFDLIVEANDQLLERIGGDLDEAAGIRRRMDTVVQTVSASVPESGPVAAATGVSARWNLTTNRTLTSAGPAAGRQVKLMAASNIERPQLSFPTKVDNTAAPFEPILTEKPHALRPLAILLETTDDGLQQFSHPYEFELERFTPSEKFLQAEESEPQMPADCLPTPVTMVTSVAGLEQLVSELSRHKTIAVDLEHHNYRSYLGLTCLIQISTTERDYIVDALQLRGPHLQKLNQVFANPAIVKVFHGADSDIEWLQRDCGVYVVHMFDTHQAAKLLGFPRLSLSYLLQHFCNVAPDKRYQLADWRIRPLPEDMLKYAQQDTHYLIYVYRRLRSLLLEKGNNRSNLLQSVYTSSRQICLKRYQKPVLRAESHLELYRRHKRSFSPRQLAALARLYSWRDQTARQEDESTQYVLPNHMLLQMAELLPREMQGVLACCNPVPPLVRQNLTQLHRLLLEARSASLGQLTPQQPARPQPVPVQTPGRSRDHNSLLHNPHDLAHLDGELGRALHGRPLLAADDTPQPMDTDQVTPAPVKPRPHLPMAGGDSQPPGTSTLPGLASLWISPCRRYLLITSQPLQDEKVARRMSELTEMTPVKTKPVTPSHVFTPPEPEAVLAEVKSEPSIQLELVKQEPPAPKRLRMSRKDVVQEQKSAGTFKKAKKKKKKGKGGAGAEPTVPLSEGPTALQKQQAIATNPGHWTRESDGTPGESPALPPDTFNYSKQDYRARFGRGGAGGEGTRGRGRGKPRPSDQPNRGKTKRGRGKRPPTAGKRQTFSMAAPAGNKAKQTQ